MRSDRGTNQFLVFNRTGEILNAAIIGLFSTAAGSSLSRPGRRIRLISASSPTTYDTSTTPRRRRWRVYRVRRISFLRRFSKTKQKKSEITYTTRSFYFQIPPAGDVREIDQNFKIRIRTTTDFKIDSFIFSERVLAFDLHPYLFGNAIRFDRRRRE